MSPYRLEECAYCQTPTWCEIRGNGKPQCRACKVERFFSEILFPPLGYRLIAWQRQNLRELYGTVREDTGRRRFRRAYWSVGKQNGKTAIIGGLPLYHLLLEDELSPEAYGTAAAKDQAGLVFKYAAQFIRANPDLRARLKVLPSTKRIIRRDGHGFYQVLSADGDVQDGIRPSLLLRDEVHRWKTQRAETLLDVTTRGQVSRPEPLDIATTTAGAEYESPLWYREYQHAKQVQTGALQDDSLHVAIYEADAKRLENDPEYWKSREARVAANPSHEDLGGFLTDEAILAELNKALAAPSEKPKYIRYHLNVPMVNEEEPIIEMPKWLACGGSVDLRTWPVYDIELLIRHWGLLGQRCYAGVDASWTTDMTALMFVFPPFEQCPDQWTLLPFFWLPKDRLEEIARICRVPLKLWVDCEFIEARPGNGIDLASVIERVKWGDKLFDMAELDFDRVNFRTEAMKLSEDGLSVVEISQNFLNLSGATKKLLSAYMDGQIRHGNNPVLNWMAGCLQLQYDSKDNCQPSKPPRGKSAKRIDGIAAAVTALSRAMLAPEPNSQKMELW